MLSNNMYIIIFSIIILTIFIVIYTYYKNYKKFLNDIKPFVDLETSIQKNIKLQILMLCIQYLNTYSMHGVWISQLDIENLSLKFAFYDSKDDRKIFALLAFNKKFGHYIKCNNISDDYSQFSLYFKKDVTENEINNLYVLLKLEGNI